ncbi:carboxypeptidase-like regulatory domain-containing protein [Tannerella forsythia]|uniref:Carboxypeptidase-like regulatory domain-containing protein n=1 Tax=Tannerella forsythia TaxID=28112 RepID=A0A3P1Z755_TANFO|nr:carboxypeptidase-like regulatory domain-containing protein [Tannerella forsythia]RRD79211.1 carboxypeptidase-like regulatory domain-containing protein [Tannerella forsythia]
MKTNVLIRFILWVAFFVAGEVSLFAQELENNYITVSGVIKDKQTNKKLVSVNVSIPQTSVGTVTNADGYFSIKVKDSLQAKNLEFSHIGYTNVLYPVGQTDIDNAEIFLLPNTNILAEVTVMGGDARGIVEEAIEKIAMNYPAKENLLTGFYREVIQKRKRYINISEAVVHIFKTPYTRGFEHDRVQVFKGRKLLSQKAGDTLVVKLEGGPNLSHYIDLIKNKELLLDKTEMENYSFRFGEPVMIDNRPHHQVNFQPRLLLPYALYYGSLYIDKETMTITRAEFNLSMDDRSKATQAMLRKKPFGLRFKPEQMTFLVAYKRHDGRSYLNYVRNEVRFKCDWKRRLFSTSYTVFSEMVVTERKEDDFSRISYKDSFKSGHSLSDKVGNFYDEDFWGGYNIIEPTESLENAVNKLKKQYK